MDNVEDVVNALTRQGTLYHRQSNSLTILMAKKSDSTELYLRKNGVPEGDGQALERRSPFSDIMPGCVPCKPRKGLTKAGTCHSSMLEVNSGAYWDYSHPLNGHWRSARAERWTTVHIGWCQKEHL